MARYRLTEVTRSVIREGTTDPRHCTTPQESAEVVRSILNEFDDDRERVIVLVLDARHRDRSHAVIAVGDQQGCVVNPAEVFTAARLGGAASIIVAHNHPSGDPSPSPEDGMLRKGD